MDPGVGIGFGDGPVRIQAKGSIMRRGILIMVTNPTLFRYHGRLERILKDIALRLELILSLEFFLRLAAVFIIILLGSLFVEELRGLFGTQGRLFPHEHALPAR